MLNSSETILNYITSNSLSFYEDQTLSKYDCWTCPMLPTCGGACPKEWSEGRIPCPPTKFNIKERMLLAVVRSQNHQQNLSI